MGLLKPKKERNGKFKAFLKKAAGIFPEVIGIAGKVATGNIGGAIQDVGTLLKEKAKTDEAAKALLTEFELARMDWQLEAFELEVEDRKSARELFKEDGTTQKILAGLFTVSYFAITIILLNYFFNDTGGTLADYELGFISTLFGAMSAKVNTIIDFFFGGSADKEK